MTGFWTILVAMLTAGVAAASPIASNLNDTLTGREGAQRIVAAEDIRTIVIDAGHGGRDAGCSGAHSKEKVLALDIALQLRELLRTRRPDLHVILTRDRDVFVPLHERASIANRAQADLFVSIHCNYLPGSTATHGSETYVMGLHTADHNLSVAKRENAAMRHEDDVDTNYEFDPDSPAGHIILSMFQHSFQEQSLVAAQAIEARLGEREGRRSRGVKQAGFMVLKETAMPSVLVETGYLSNAIEEEYLRGEVGQTATAEALLSGLEDYLKELEASATDQIGVERSLLAKLPAEAPVPIRRRHHEAISEPADSLTIAPGKLVAVDRVTKQPELKLYVQLLAAGKQADTETKRWRELDTPVRYVREKGMYKYQAGPFASFGEADLVLAKASQAGFTGAFIAGYTDGNRVSAKKLKQLRSE